MSRLTHVLPSRRKRKHLSGQLKTVVHRPHPSNGLAWGMILEPEFESCRSVRPAKGPFFSAPYPHPKSKEQPCTSSTVARKLLLLLVSRAELEPATH